MKNIIDIMNFRYACRNMNPNKKISKQDISIIMEAGRLSPSSLGLEHWKFLVVSGDKAKLMEMALNQKQVGDSSHVIVILHKKDNLLTPEANYVKEKIDRIKVDDEVKSWIHKGYENYYKSVDVDYWSKAQCYIASSSMMIAAASLGIDSSPMEGFDEKAILDYYDIDEEKYGVALIVCFGYREEEQPERLRSKIEDLVIFKEE